MAKYDKPLDTDEEEKSSRVLRLPYALCKQRGIYLPPSATPRDAWRALEGIGMSPEREMQSYFEKRVANKRYQEKKKTRNEQMKMLEHNPDYKQSIQEGFIAGVQKGNPMTFEQADGNKANPYYGKKRADGKDLYGYSTNCQTCVVAFEARLRGYDVRALPNLRNPYIKDLAFMTNIAYIDEEGNHPAYSVRKNREKAYDFVNNTVKDGARYTLEFGWGKSRDGHIVSVEKVNGAIRIYDPQTGKIITGEKNIKSYLSRTSKQKIMRVDDCEFDSDYVNHILKGSKV